MRLAEYCALLADRAPLANRLTKRAIARATAIELEGEQDIVGRPRHAILQQAVGEDDVAARRLKATADRLVEERPVVSDICGAGDY